MNIANKLTLMRVFLIPVFIVLYVNQQIPYNEIIAAGIFVVASLTDFLDGYLARKYNLVTNFGKFLDPLADKLLVNMALICFLTVPDNPVPFWVVLIIISRDFIISGFRLVASDNGVVIAADYWGKVKTATQMVMIILVILNFDNTYVNVIENVLIYVSVILTVVSLIDCLVKNINVLKDDKVDNIEEEIVKKLTQKNLTITFAESCTGGMLCSKIVDVPGSSAVVKQSAVTYCNDAKMNLLGVPKDIIDKYTEVSEETASLMAEGAAKWADSDIAVSITGIAGPDGGTDEKPVGLVYIGVYNNGKTTVTKSVFKGNRNAVREQAAQTALNLVSQLL